jgi:hypothetical protein
MSWLVVSLILLIGCSSRHQSNARFIFSLPFGVAAACVVRSKRVHFSSVTP